MVRSFVYEPLASCVQDCTAAAIGICNKGAKEERGPHLSKESTPENSTAAIEPVDDRIRVLLHRCSEDD
jgi:hypothetical protein